MRIVVYEHGRLEIIVLSCY